MFFLIFAPFFLVSFNFIFLRGVTVGWSLILSLKVQFEIAYLPLRKVSLTWYMGEAF